MDELVRWLTAQLDADQAEAEKLTDDDDYGLDASALRWEETGEWNSYPYLRISKARVLREIDAKRRTLVRCQEAMLSASPMLVHFAKQTAWEMALPYADRPGYRETWRP